MGKIDGYLRQPSANRQIWVPCGQSQKQSGVQQGSSSRVQSCNHVSTAFDMWPSKGKPEDASGMTSEPDKASA